MWKNTDLHHLYVCFKMNICKVLTSTQETTAHVGAKKKNILWSQRPTLSSPVNYIQLWFIIFSWKIVMSMIGMVNKQWMKSSYPHAGPHNVMYACMTLQSLPLSSCRRCFRVGWQLCFNTHQTLNIILFIDLHLCIPSHYCQNRKETSIKKWK